MNITGKLQLTEPSDEIIKFDLDFFSPSWTPKQWAELNPKDHKLFSWYQSENLIGFALFRILQDDDVAHLYKIIIHPDFRNKGEAQAFWLAILENLINFSCSSVYLEVNKDNAEAIRFYKKCRFETLREIKRYYSTGEDALVMRLML